MLTKKQWNEFCNKVRKIREEGDSVYFHHRSNGGTFVVIKCGLETDEILLYPMAKWEGVEKYDRGFVWSLNFRKKKEFGITDPTGLSQFYIEVPLSL